MAIASESEVKNKLAALQMEFKQNLSVKISAIVRYRDLLVADDRMSELTDLYRMVRSLAGSGGTFGAISVSRLARDLEQILKSVLAGNHQQALTIEAVLPQVDHYLTQIAQTAETWQPTNVPYIEPPEEKIPHIGNLVYFLGKNEPDSKEIVSRLEKENYIVNHFSLSTEFELALKKEVPAAIILDMVYVENDATASEVIQNIKIKQDVCPPVIFISERDDIETRLTAARAGAVRY